MRAKNGLMTAATTTFEDWHFKMDHKAVKKTPVAAVKVPKRRVGVLPNSPWIFPHLIKPQ